MSAVPATRHINSCSFAYSPCNSWEIKDIPPIPNSSLPGNFVRGYKLFYHSLIHPTPVYDSPWPTLPVYLPIAWLLTRLQHHSYRPAGSPHQTQKDFAYKKHRQMQTS